MDHSNSRAAAKIKYLHKKQIPRASTAGKGIMIVAIKDLVPSEVTYTRAYVNAARGKPIKSDIYKHDYEYVAERAANIRKMQSDIKAGESFPAIEIEPIAWWANNKQKIFHRKFLIRDGHARYLAHRFAGKKFINAQLRK